MEKVESVYDLTRAQVACLTVAVKSHGFGDRGEDREGRVSFYGKTGAFKRRLVDTGCVEMRPRYVEEARRKFAADRNDNVRLAKDDLAADRWRRALGFLRTACDLDAMVGEQAWFVSAHGRAVLDAAAVPPDVLEAAR